MKRYIVNAGMFLSAVALALIIMEAFSRIFFKSDFTHVVNKNGEIVSMQIEPGNPSAGLTPFFDGRMVSGEFEVSVRLDSLGFRDRVVYGNDTATAPVQITLLGDSFMFGWGVEFSQSFASHLATYLSGLIKKRVVVSPLAIPGIGQFTQVALLRRTPSPKPDVVVLGMYVTNHVASGNDLIENLDDFYKFQGITPDVLNKAKGFARPGSLFKVRRWLKHHSNLFRAVETRLGAMILTHASAAIKIESDPTVMARAWAVTDSILFQLQKTVAEQGAIFAIQYVPNMLDVAKHDSGAFVRLRETCVARNIPLAPNPISFFNPSETEQGRSVRDFYFLVDGHWTAKAHQVTAGAAARFLAERLFKPAEPAKELQEVTLF